MVELLVKISKVFKWIIVAIVLVVVVKWAVLLTYPYTQDENKKQTVKPKVIQSIESRKELQIDYSTLLPQAKSELDTMDADIEAFASEKLSRIKTDMEYGLTRTDGFLDWLYGWWTGYRIAFNALLGWATDDDDAKELIEGQFKELVIREGEIESRLREIADFASRRQKEYYAAVLDMVKEKTESTIDAADANNIEIDLSQIPWGKYIAQGALDGSGIGFAGGAVIAKGAAAKIASSKAMATIGSKVTAMVGAKATSSIASIVVDVSSLGLGILFDYLFNEGYEAINRGDDEIHYKKTIDNIVYGRLAENIAEFRREISENTYRNISEQLDRRAALKIKH